MRSCMKFHFVFYEPHGRRPALLSLMSSFSLDTKCSLNGQLSYKLQFDS